MRKLRKDVENEPERKIELATNFKNERDELNKKKLSDEQIEKIVENERTKTKVTKLNEKEVVNEIARILAGNDVTKAVLEHAKEIRKAV